MSYAPLDTAVFPSPTTSFAPRLGARSQTNTGCCASCQHSTRFDDDSTVTLENVASQANKMVHEMLQFPPSDGTSVENDSLLQLPEIGPYLPANTDKEVAEALTALYRTHCISVIDSFRYCKERNMLKFFSSFHGTLTVPVQKLLTHPNVAPWIKECDWLMYQKMIAFVAPLTTQVVPKVVLDAFSSISRGLTMHIAETFKAQPVHVSLARLIPAHVFCNLLNHMLDVNQAANAAAAWLCHPDNRNQMWFDFKTLVDPREMLAKANIPSCAAQATEAILKHDVRALLTPIDDAANASIGQPFFKQPDSAQGLNSAALRVPPASAADEEYNFPDKWIAFILNLPANFPRHRTQCIIDKVDALWDCILRRLTLGGAQSFSAWWMTKVFFHEMMRWQAEKGGFMTSTPAAAATAAAAAAAATGLAVLGKRLSIPSSTDRLQNPSNDSPSNASDMHGASSNGSSRAGHASHAGASLSSGSPTSQGQGQKQMQGQTNDNNSSEHATDNMAHSIASLQGASNDDSAIDLDDDSMLISVGKYGDMMASDPADAEGDVVVI